MRLIWILTVLSWLLAGLAPLHAATMDPGPQHAGPAHAGCCPDSEDTTGRAHPPCEHASVCASLLMPAQTHGPARALTPIALPWGEPSRAAASAILSADPPPPRA